MLNNRFMSWLASRPRHDHSHSLGPQPYEVNMLFVILRLANLVGCGRDGIGQPRWDMRVPVDDTKVVRESGSA